MLMSAKGAAAAEQRDRYSTVAIAFHWTIAALIAGQLFLGWHMGDVSGLGRSTLLRLHESFGILVLLLTAGRLFWRYRNPPPAPESSLTPLEHKLSHWVHMGFYGALFALPLSGWAMVSMEQAGGLKLFNTVPWFAFPIVRWLPSGVQDVLADLSGDLHQWLVWLMLLLMFLHIAGALKHHFISRDRTVARMAPGAKPGLVNEPRLLAIPLVTAALAGLVYLSQLPHAAPRPKATVLAKADIYLDVVGPAMERRCVNCHADDQSRGGLSLSSFDSMMRGGRDGPVVVAGDLKKSELYRRMLLPPGDKQYMPKGDRPPLTADQLAAVALWIQIGAPRSGAVGTLHLKEDQLATLSRVLNLDVSDADTGPKAFDENANLPKVDKADGDTVKLLESNGFIVRPVAATSNLVDVDFTIKRDLNADDLARLGKIAPQILRLNLHRSNLTDAQLKTVSAFPRIRRLRLDYTAVTDAGLSALAGMKDLSSLSLTNTKVTDSGIASLAQVKNLHRLYVWQSAVTPAAIEKLKMTLPEVTADIGKNRAAVPAPGPLMQPVN